MLCVLSLMSIDVKFRDFMLLNSCSYFWFVTPNVYATCIVYVTVQIENCARNASGCWKYIRKWENQKWERKKRRMLDYYTIIRTEKFKNIKFWFGFPFWWELAAGVLREIHSRMMLLPRLDAIVFLYLFFLCFFARFRLLLGIESNYRSTQFMSVKSMSRDIVCLIEFSHSLCKQHNSVSSCCTHNYTWSRFIISFGGAARSINAFNLKLGHVHRFKKKIEKKMRKECLFSLTHSSTTRSERSQFCCQITLKSNRFFFFRLQSVLFLLALKYVFMRGRSIKSFVLIFFVEFFWIFYDRIWPVCPPESHSQPTYKL